MRLLFSIISTLILGGCVQVHYRDIPHPPITQEQDTPFVFKERYQTVDTGLTTVRIEHKSDFVVIETTDEVVFWHPNQSMHDAGSSVVLPEQIEKTPNIAKTRTPEPANSDVDPDPKNTLFALPANADTGEGTCKPVLCDGIVCGDIAVCGDGPCDNSLKDKYSCSDTGCDLVAAHPSEEAKSDPCHGFAQLDTCFIDTHCKRHGRLTRGINNESE